MSLTGIIGEARRIGVVSLARVVGSHIRLYGWSATFRKVSARLLRADASFGDFAESLRKQGTDAVDPARDVFASPAILICGSLDLPQCKKYRVLQKVEFFQSRSWACRYAEYRDQPRMLRYLQISSAVIFYRVPAGKLMDMYLKECKRLGIATCYDIDDPIFARDVYSANANLSRIDPMEARALIEQCDVYKSAMSQVDFLILSTPALRNLAHRQTGVPAYTWPNLVDPATLSVVEQLHARNAREANSVVIGYVSGSRAHDEDFGLIASVLSEILSTHPGVSLRVMGYGSLPESMDRFKDRVDVRPFTAYSTYLQELKDVDLTVIPLVNDTFNACKSAIRFYESAVCGVPAIASTVGEFSSVMESGVDGFLADTDDAWRVALNTLVASRELRISMGEAARARVMQTRTLSALDAIDPELIAQFA